MGAYLSSSQEAKAPLEAKASQEAKASPVPPFPPKEFDDIPIVLMSIHGRYNDATKFIVPSNTWIFETVDVGDLCMNTIDQPLWELVQGQNREKFLAYLKGEDTDDEPTLRDKFKYAISQFNYYKPGDTIYERGFTLSEEDKEMNFFLFPKGKKFIRPDQSAIIMKALRTRLIKTGKYKRTSVIIDTVRTEYPALHNGCIFIISSCGAIIPTLYKKIGTEIEEHQRHQLLKFMELTTAASAGAVSMDAELMKQSHRYPIRHPENRVLLREEKTDTLAAMSKADIGISAAAARTSKRFAKACAKICSCSPDVGDCLRCRKMCKRTKSRFSKTMRKRK